jgi:hypothetical protein
MSNPFSLEEPKILQEIKLIFEKLRNVHLQLGDFLDSEVLIKEIDSIFGADFLEVYKIQKNIIEINKNGVTSLC